MSSACDFTIETMRPAAGDELQSTATSKTPGEEEKVCLSCLPRMAGVLLLPTALRAVHGQTHSSTHPPTNPLLRVDGLWPRVRCGFPLPGGGGATSHCCEYAPSPCCDLVAYARLTLRTIQGPASTPGMILKRPFRHASLVSGAVKARSSWCAGPDAAAARTPK